CSPSRSPGRGARDVNDTDRQMLRSRFRHALTMLDFPAPDGAATMKRVPRRPGSGIGDSGFDKAGSRLSATGAPSYRFGFSGPTTAEGWSSPIAVFNGRMSGLPESRLSLNVLHLLADLVDQHLQLDRGVAGARVDRLASERVGLPVELLQQEVQAPAHGLLLAEHAPDFVDVAGQAVELLVHVELLQRQHQFLLDPRRIGGLGEVGQARGEPGALALADQRHQAAHFSRDALDAVDALEDRGHQLAALALAAGDEIVE